jgi:hypothetical protein
VVKAGELVGRTVETLGGPVQLARPSFSGRSGRCGHSPFDEAGGVVAGCTPLDLPRAAAQLVTAVPYDTAQSLVHDLTGVPFGSDRMHPVTNQVAAALTVGDVAPSREESERRIAAVAVGRLRRPILVLGIDGASVPTRPARARGRRPGPGRPRAKRALWRGQWRDATGVRLYWMDGERSVHGLRWPQVHTEDQLGAALKHVKESGLIPADQGRLCVVADGASWIWQPGKALCPHACQVLDYDHCAEDLPRVAKAPYGASVQAWEWVEATMTRL